MSEATNRVPSAKNMTFKELSKRWLEEYATTCKESTVSSRKSLANHITYLERNELTTIIKQLENNGHHEIAQHQPLVGSLLKSSPFETTK